MRTLGIILTAVGLTWALLAWNMNTVVETKDSYVGSLYIPSQKVHNLGLIESRRNHLMLASVTVIAGILLFGFGVLSGRNAERNEEQSSESRLGSVDTLPPLYTGQGLDDHNVGDLQQAEASLRAAGIDVRRDGPKWELRDQKGSLSYVWSSNDLIAAAKSRGTPPP